MNTAKLGQMQRSDRLDDVRAVRLRWSGNDQGAKGEEAAPNRMVLRAVFLYKNTHFLKISLYAPPIQSSEP